MIKNNKKTNNILILMRLLCVVAIILASTNKADANIDSLRQIWANVTQPDSTRFNAINENYNKIFYSQPDSIILLAAYHLELAEKKNSQKQKAIALNKKAIAYNIKGDYDYALIEMKKAVDIYSSLEDSINLMKVYNNLALIYYHQIEYEEALKYFSIPHAFYQANKIKNMEASISVNIGLIHVDISNYDMALEYFNKSLYIYKELEIENSEEVGNLWQNIANTNFRKKNYHQAIENSQKALKIHESLNKPYFTAQCYSLKARVYQELNQIDSALFYIEKGLQLHLNMGNDLKILKDQILLANLISLTDLNQAIIIGEKVLQTVDEHDSHSMKIELYSLLYKCYKQKGDYPLSMAMLEKHNNYSDSLRLEQDKTAVIKNALRNKYEIEIFNTQLKNEQSQSELKLNQSIKAYTTILFSSLLILCIFFYSRSKRIIQNKEKEVLLDKVSQLEELEDSHHRLVQSNKMASIGQLTAGVAHEINNPINFIANGVQGLKMTLNEYIKSPKNETTDELVNDMNDMITAIEEGAQRTSVIVKNLHHFSREDTRNYVEADIIKGLESTFTLLSNKLKKGISIEKEFGGSTMLIFCFPGQLNQVFMNIMLNAIQAIEEDGTIKVKIKEHEKSITISISDNGTGIPDDKKQQIFEPFYTTKSTQEGTGLGLSITNGIIKKHKGSIEVKDNDPKGTTFIINLPKREASLINSIS